MYTLYYSSQTKVGSLDRNSSTEADCINLTHRQAEKLVSYILRHWRDGDDWKTLTAYGWSCFVEREKFPKWIVHMLEKKNV